MASPNRKYGRKTGRKADGRFGPGNPGKPKGSRHRTTVAVEILLEGEAEALTRNAIERALEGDMAALKLCLDRIATPRKDRPVAFSMPKAETTHDALVVLGSILQAVSSGELTPDEGLTVAKLIDIQRRLIETEQLEVRLTELEEIAMRRPKQRRT